MMEDIYTAISTVGFPIVAFFAMYWFAKNTVEKNTDAINKLTLMIGEKI